MPLRWDRDARHGTALVGIVFAAFVNLTTDFSSIIQAWGYAGTIPNDVPFVNLVQFLCLLGVYLVSFALIATTPLRRAIALTVVPLLLLGWAWINVERGTGGVPLGASGIWGVLLDQGFITLVAALGGLLIARALHPLSWIALSVALLPPLAAAGVGSARLDATTTAILLQSVVVASGVLGAAVAILVDRVARNGPRRGLLRPVSFNRSTRYGLAMGALGFATYLSIATDFTGYLDQSRIGTAASTSALGMLQFAVILALFVTAFAVIPTTSTRRAAAVTLACVVLFLWAALGIERSIGNVVDPRPLWFVLLNQGFVSVLVALGGWLIVRERHPLSYVVLPLALVPPVIARTLVDSSVTSGAYTLALEGTVIAAVIAGGVIAGGIDAGVRRFARRGQPRVARTETPRSRRVPARGRPRLVSAVAVATWIIGAVQILAGLFALTGDGVSGADQRTAALVGSLVAIVLGAGIVIAGAGLLDGRPAARIAVTVLVSLSIAEAVVSAFGDPVDAMASGIEAVLDVLALVALWIPRSSAYFHSRSAT